MLSVKWRVHHPFWRDWPLAEPSLFLTPEPLHHWHKMFWDHDSKWCIWAVGAAKIDFQFLVLQPHVGFRHFTEGISGLKQVTGHKHHDVQHYIVGVIAGAIPRDFLIAIWASMDFQYLCLVEEIDNGCCNRIQAALNEFHAHKSATTDAGACVGVGNRPINNWYIPELEMMQSVISNIWANGAIIQYSADVMEHAHIMEIKNPAQAGNNQCYEAQICHDLDHTDKLCHFKLATMIRDPHLITVILTIICWLQHNLLMAHINPTIITLIKLHTFKIMTEPCIRSAHLQNLISHSISITPQVSSKWLSMMWLRSLGSQIFALLSQIFCVIIPQITQLIMT